MQQALFHESIHDALREVIRAAGGSKVVGCKLWPSLPVDQAASKISDCLNPDRRQHFNEAELLHLLRIGREMQALQQQFILATKELKAMSQRLEAITARANLTAVR